MKIVRKINDRGINNVYDLVYQLSLPTQINLNGKIRVFNKVVFNNHYLNIHYVIL